MIPEMAGWKLYVKAGNTSGRRGGLCPLGVDYVKCETLFGDSSAVLTLCDKVKQFPPQSQTIQLFNTNLRLHRFYASSNKKKCSTNLGFNIQQHIRDNMFSSMYNVGHKNKLTSSVLRALFDARGPTIGAPCQGSEAQFCLKKNIRVKSDPLRTNTGDRSEAPKNDLDGPEEHSRKLVDTS
ncbi:hypothetical protein C8R44DRAFT_733066 [Mycena epipterygia]|nr:hypothetical protein C8R44DRAFT_733066 [Mycena epipterygia]